MKQLKEKAFLVLSQYRSNTPVDASSQRISIFDSQTDGMDELALFGGQTRVLITKTSSQTSTGRQMRPKQMDSMKNPSSSSSRVSPPSTPGPDSDVFPDIHPSLVQYMSLLPQETLAADFTGHPVPNFNPQFAEQVAFNGVVPAAWNTQLPGGHLQNEMIASTSSGSAVNDTNSFDLLQEFYQNAPVTTINTWGSNDLTDLGQMMNIVSDIDEQWMSFMK